MIVQRQCLGPIGQGGGSQARALAPASALAASPAPASPGLSPSPVKLLLLLPGSQPLPQLPTWQGPQTEVLGGGEAWRSEGGSSLPLETGDSGWGGCALPRWTCPSTPLLQGGWIPGVAGEGDVAALVLWSPHLKAEEQPWPGEPLSLMGVMGHTGYPERWAHTVK